MKEKPWNINLLHKKHGETLSEGATVTFYTANISVARSNMSAKIALFIVLDGEIVCLGRERINGCGLDRGHEYAYRTFLKAWPNARYQNHLKHEWLNV